ncbi:hypothetical protein Q1695_000693 [Nippostrongylus brasiliensis]|nr:hypothetical protein Q1695_000693 [Nippostrongylus brasiliensis]
MMHAGVVLFAVVMVSTAVDDDRVTHCIKKFNLDTRSETANLVNESDGTRIFQAAVCALRGRFEGITNHQL